MSALPFTLLDTFIKPGLQPFPCPRRACRHGDRCSRMHNRPTISQTILLQNMYQNPVVNAPLGPDGLPLPVDPKAVTEIYEASAAAQTQPRGSD